jgi:hypothetical protein
MQSLWQATDGRQSFSLKELAIMNATTLNGMNRTLASGTVRRASQVGASSFKMPNFHQVRAALPDLPSTESVASVAAGVALRLTLAAVPFGALSWLFLAR